MSEHAAGLIAEIDARISRMNRVRADVMELFSTEPIRLTFPMPVEVAPKKERGRKAKAAPGKRNGRLKRADEARSVIAGMSATFSTKEAGTALADAGLEFTNISSVLGGAVKAGLIEHDGRGQWKRVKTKASVSEELEARKASLGIATKPKED